MILEHILFRNECNCPRCRKISKYRGTSWISTSIHKAGAMYERSKISNKPSLG